MTNPMMNLCALVEKAPDANVLRKMIGFAAQRLMELEVGALTGAAAGEQSPDRLVQRNGYPSQRVRLRLERMGLFANGRRVSFLDEARRVA
jgi:hypothetical protein